MVGGAVAMVGAGDLDADSSLLTTPTAPAAAPAALCSIPGVDEDVDVFMVSKFHSDTVATWISVDGGATSRCTSRRLVKLFCRKQELGLVD